eukprot:SAG11_NODE_27874_length_327_cov_7.934211_1_plen_89_part_10
MDILTKSQENRWSQIGYRRPDDRKSQGGSYLDCKAAEHELVRSETIPPPLRGRFRPTWVTETNDDKLFTTYDTSVLYFHNERSEARNV